MNKLCRLIFYFLFLTSSVSAQVKDTVQKEVFIPTVTRFLKLNDFFLIQKNFQNPDTTFYKREITSPIQKYFFRNLENNGSAAKEKIFVSDHSLGLKSFHMPYRLNMLWGDSVKYFKTNKRYSELNFYQRSNKENNIAIQHNQNIRPEWSAGFTFNRLSVPGFLLNATTYNSNFEMHTWYHTMNNRYHALAYYVVNNLSNRMNGGFANDSIYDNTAITNLSMKGLAVNLNDNLKLRNRQLMIKQYFSLNSKPDSSAFSSYIAYTAKFNKSWMNYLTNETDSSFYPNLYYSDNSIDSIAYEEWQHEISLPQVINVENSKYTFSPFVILQSLHHHQRNIDSTLDRTFAGVQFASIIKNKLFLNAKASFDLTGNSDQVYCFDANVALQFSSKLLLKFGGIVSSAEPTLAFQRFDSRFYKWENNFNVTQTNSIHASISAFENVVEIEGIYTALNNFVYVNGFSRPQQLKGNLSLFQAITKLHFKFGKFNFTNHFAFQSVNYDSVIHLPSFTGYHALYYEGDFFKKALHAAAGFNLKFTTAYYADAFNPATELFYVQSSIKTNGVPVIDFFIHMKIKSAILTLKLDNITDNITHKGYYLTPHYGMPGRTFTIGLNWKFFDQ